MKIVVAVKCVAQWEDVQETLADSGYARDLDELALNEWDEFALEAALQLREQVEHSEVLVLTVASDSADEPLRGCLAKGADRAMRVWDERLSGADPLVVGRILAAAAVSEAASLVLCGTQSADAGNAATGVAMAAFLEIPWVAVVRGLEYDPVAATATVERELEGGLVEVLRVRTPALLTVQTGINEPRYANLRAIKRSREQPIELLGLRELGLDDGLLASTAGSRSLGYRRRLSAGDVEMLGGDAAEVASRITEIVRERIAG